VEGSLTHRVARGISWTGAAQVADYAVTVASLSVLAHLLRAADFGAQAAASAAVGVALMVGDLGLGSALIQAPVLGQGEIRRATLLCALSGIALGGLTLALSPWIGGFFREGEVVGGLLRILWPCALLHPIGAVPRALMTRGMDFRRLAMIDAASAVASGATAVALALRGAGASSLAWGYVARVAVASGLAWVMSRNHVDRGSWIVDRPSPLRPSPTDGRGGVGGRETTGTTDGADEGSRTGRGVSGPRITNHESRGEARGLFRFGLNAMGAGVLNYLSASVDYLLIGRYLGPAALGLYYLAYQLVSLAHFKVVAILLKVLHPALATVQEDLERFRRGYLRAVRGISLFVFPALGLLWALADPVVTVFYGADKAAAVRLVEILCALGIAKSVGGAVGPVFLGRGRSDISFLWNLFALATTTVAVAAGLPFGAEGAAVAVSLNALLLLAVSEAIVHRLLPLDFRAYLGSLAPALLCAALAGVVTRWAAGLASSHSPAAALVFGGALGALVYAALIRAFHRTAASEAIELVRAWRG
jgi:O-antigen/teichoic acid export membrane protein